MKDLFTKQEKIFILFLLGGILFGSGVKLYKTYFPTMPKYAYNVEKFSTTKKQIEEKAQYIDSLLAVKMENPPALKTVVSAKPESRKQEKGAATIQAVEINTAGVDGFKQLPHIGPVLAQRIVDHRNQHGPFRSIEDICKVKGIGKKTFDLIKPHIFITPQQH
ncbi:MAG: ComEA family DNA-binding protein [Candidatus Zhuqueibacterota bacterium]